MSKGRGGNATTRVRKGPVKARPPKVMPKPKSPPKVKY